MIKPLDRNALREQFKSATPFPFVCIDNFLEPAFAQELVRSFPSRDQTASMGQEFSALNERGKIQVTDSSLFPAPIARLNAMLAEPDFLEDLEYITGIPKLLADATLSGGGMHCTGPRGRLDVHVDFNFFEDQQLHRRLNILVYLNPEWEADWGGDIELWDTDVKHCHHRLAPVLNRCVLFETSDISYHGVAPVTCPEGTSRKSFAAYYYTAEAPDGWDGDHHCTRFRARPDEKLRRYLWMPLEKAQRQGVPKMKQGIKRLLGRV